MTSNDAGPERGSWRVVWPALRDGHVADPRYAALTWDTANRNARNGWLLGIFGVALSIQVTVVVFRLARGADSFATATTAVSALFLAIGLGFVWVGRLRGKRFLKRNGATPGTHASDQV